MVDRERTLLSLTQKMHAATGAEDWPTLAALNTLLASALPQMAAQGPWDAAEMAALAALHQSHRQAVRRCDLATAEAGRKITALQTNKEGLLAYALDSELAENGTIA